MIVLRCVIVFDSLLLWNDNSLSVFRAGAALPRYRCATVNPIALTAVTRGIAVSILHQNPFTTHFLYIVLYCFPLLY